MKRRTAVRSWGLKRVSLLCALLALIGLAISSGTSSAAESSHAKSTTTTPKSGGILKIGLDSDPVCVDPTQTGLIASLEISQDIVNTLLVQNPKTLVPEPGLAESFTPNKSATSFHFVLHPGITFSNGQPLDASTVKYFFDQVFAMGAKAPDPEGYLVGYKDTVVTGKYSFTINFSSPNSQFPIALTMANLGILAPATMNATLADRCAGKDLYGTGPYVLKSYTVNTSVILVKRKGFKWGEAYGPLADHTGPAYFNEIEWIIEPESGVRSGSLHSGQVDLATLIAPQDEAGLRGNGFHILSGITGGVPVGMAANMTGSKILQDPIVREAIQDAISRPAIEESQNKSYGVATSALSDSTLGWINLSKYLKFDPQKADSLLNNDGWKMQSDGIRSKDGQALNLTLLDFYEPNVYQVAAEELRTVGINLQLDVVPVAEYTAQREAGNYDLSQSALSHQDPVSLWTVFGDTALGGGNSAWFTSSTPGATRFDQIGAELLHTTAVAKRIKLAQEGQELLIKDDYYFPLSNIAEVDGVSNKVKNVSMSAAKYLVLYNAYF